MRYVKFLLVPMLFVSLAFMNIGGCGGGGGGNGGGAGLFCEMPRLTTDFNGTVYVFFDFIRDVDIAVTSDSQIVGFSISDFLEELFAVADVTGDNTCVITGVSDGEFVVPASGTCERQADGDSFIIRNFTALGADFPTVFQGFCDEVVNTNSSTLSESASKDLEDNHPDTEAELMNAINELNTRFREAKGQ